ncbi:MAG: sigma-54-dependent transcriptional regulator [Pseudomonadales bacterium]
MGAVLILDHDDRHASALADLVESHGFEVLRYGRLEDARGLPEDAVLALAFVTVECPDGSGLDLLEHPAICNANDIVLMNATDVPELVNLGMEAGAAYFFCKPFDPEIVGNLLADVAEESEGEATGLELETPIDQFGLLRGSSAVMHRLYRVMRKVAPTDTSVLLVGESGTGKELVARTLHLQSERSEGAFVTMNCSAIPKELFESELFGHEKGAFSSAHRRHLGYFERADGGTLFLDEITEMPLELQAKLLRVLESGHFRRVGGEEDLHSDVRILAATNREPEAAIAGNLLREDLYYRIARFPLFLPPLRERDQDVRGLALYFLNELNTAGGGSVGITEEALARIEACAWPGNVRELSAAMERAYILAEGDIEPRHLDGLDERPLPPDYIRVAATASVDEAERKLILAALEKYRGDKPAAAESLGISLKTLYNRLNEYAEGEDPPR